MNYYILNRPGAGLAQITLLQAKGLMMAIYYHWYWVEKKMS